MTTVGENENFNVSGSKAEENGQFRISDFFQGLVSAIILSLFIISLPLIMSAVSGDFSFLGILLIIISIITIRQATYYWKKRPGLSYGILCPIVFLWWYVLLFAILAVL